MAYNPQGIDDTTQQPVDLTFTSGEKDNIPFGVTLPSVAGTETGLDAASVQVGIKSDGSAILVSPIGATTFSKSAALV